MRNSRSLFGIMLPLLLSFTACSGLADPSGQTEPPKCKIIQENESSMETEDKSNDIVQSEADMEMSAISPGEKATEKNKYTDQNGDIVIIPKDFTVSSEKTEQSVNTGVVVIGPDGSEFVWVPTTHTALATRDFGSYFYGWSSRSDYWDETDLDLYKDMIKSVERYGGFYMGRFEASYGNGNKVSDYTPASKRLARPWVRFSPQDIVIACQNLYAENETVQGFFPWGINYDTTLQWLIDSGCKTEEEVTKDSTSWGNYSDDSFSQGADGSATGKWEETGANNIYDLAGNNWEWTQERYGSGNYVMRGGGYNLMGGSCSGADYPAALRDPLPGNDHHPNVTFRVALFVK